MVDIVVRRVKKMCRRNRSHDNYQEQPIGAIAVVVSFAALVTGTAMIILYNNLKSECKMKVIDSSTFSDHTKIGNIPRWFHYCGQVFVISGAVACFTVGCVPNCVRTCLPCCGPAVAALLTGVLGQMANVLFFVVASLCNGLGNLWLVLAAKTRTGDEWPGDDHYCHPTLWNVAQFVAHAYWVAAVFVLITAGSAVHKFMRRHESDYEKVPPTRPPPKKGKKAKKTSGK